MYILRIVIKICLLGFGVTEYTFDHTHWQPSSSSDLVVMFCSIVWNGVQNSSTPVTQFFMSYSTLSVVHSHWFASTIPSGDSKMNPSETSMPSKTTNTWATLQHSPWHFCKNHPKLCFHVLIHFNSICIAYIITSTDFDLSVNCIEIII